LIPEGEEAAGGEPKKRVQALSILQLRKVIGNTSVGISPLEACKKKKGASTVSKKEPQKA